MKKFVLTTCSVLFVLCTTHNAMANKETIMKSMHNEQTNPMMSDYMTAMDKMHKPMMDGIKNHNPDIAFIKGMIPHHQGAIDMAKIELKYGKDPKTKALAEEIIKSQEKEIALMKQWLETHKDK